MPIHTVARPGGLTAGVGGVVVAPRSQPYVLCGDAHGWNVNGFDARLRWLAASLVQLSCSCLVLLRGWGWGCGGGNVGWVVAGWVSGTLLGPERPHRCSVWCFWWSAPGPQTASSCWLGCVCVGRRVWCCSYVENCIVDASIFEFLWSSC